MTGLGALSRRMRSSSLGTKLALMGAVLTAAVIGGTFVILRRGIAENVRRVFVTEMHASQGALRQIEQHDRLLQLRQVLQLAGSPTLRAALDAWRSGSSSGALAEQGLRTIDHEIHIAFEGVDADLLVITDPAGVVLAQTGTVEGPPPGFSLDQSPAVHSALHGDVAVPDSLVGVLTAGAVPVEIAAVPVLVDGFPIGALLLGRRVDRIARADTTAGTAAVIASETQVLASSLRDMPVGSIWRPRLSRVDNGMATLTLQGTEYVTATVPIGRRENGRPVVLFLVRSLEAAIGPIEASLTRQFLLAGLLAIGLVGAGGAVLSRTTLRPLSDFVSFMESASHAQDYARFDTASDSPGEIRALTGTYNRLIESLRAGNQELARANRRLNSQIERRERAEHALRESEEHLRQSQKLEALGALAGGVAHDFNNILSIILGYAEIVQAELAANTTAHADVKKISDAAGRARALVRQLLAFSRKQVLQPQLVDLNEVVTGVRQLLRPLIGENIVLELKLAPDLVLITADPGQIEQVIMNLAVNARDAMPSGGRLVIETANVDLEARGDEYPVSAGPVAMLAVADNGIGMDAATRERIFEPFFTTKPVGRGTGLGLATVYGIVRQSEGNITVFSEPGEGSTFRCYFPATRPVPIQDLHAPDVGAGAGGGETILIAEDEAELRVLMRRALERQGYHVLEAADGAEALTIAARFAGRIHLLISDVVMPELSGTQLAEQLTATRPDLRVLFLSGYSNEAIEQHGVLAPESLFLEKPVSPEALARSVRDLLDAEPAGSAA
jgi:two-component system cell cycle sensor histidine kinase/response regulator CckA